MRRAWRWIKRFLVLLLVGLVVASVGIYFYLRTSVATLEATLTAPGLNGTVEIVRDRNAVPHIYATTERDAYFALGYVHAQDRLFQMEMTRRLAAGRVSEIAGASSVRFDITMRVLGLYKLAEENYKSAPPELRAAAEAYAAGVNFFLESRDGALPPEYFLSQLKPEPWTAVDSLAWGKLIAIQLSTNWRSELLRARLVDKFSSAMLESLFPPTPDAPTTIKDERKTEFRDLPLQQILAAIPDWVGTGASNEWTVAGSRTATGKPILANDPHLPMGVPILWYLARIEAPGLTITGATVPGVPFHLIGHNGRIAWGVTTTHIDTDDVFIEKLDPADPTKYLTPDGPQSFTLREETIRVRGNDPVKLSVRYTRHGPVINDLLKPDEQKQIPQGHVLALSAPWLRVEDTTAAAVYRVNRARNWDEFTEALKQYQSPAQNFAYADVDGNIGYRAAGLVPIRKSGDGYMPAPGWTGEADWTGFIPFDKMPSTYNPPSGAVVNANNRTVGSEYPYFLTRDWPSGYRAQRITDLIGDKGTLDHHAKIQNDNVSLFARELLPIVLKTETTDARAKDALALLAKWDGNMDRTRPEPLIFTAWMIEMNKRIYADRVAALDMDYGGYLPAAIKNVLTGNQDLCDDPKTSDKDNCASALTATLNAAVAWLTDRYGKDMSAWRWGQAHFADLRHRLFDFLPIVRNFANLKIPADGGSETVNRAGFSVRDAADPMSLRHGPGFRGVYDLSDLSKSRFVIATGQSGNPFSPHYADMLERWRDGRYVEIAQTKAAAVKDSIGIVTLRPGGAR